MTDRGMDWDRWEKEWQRPASSASTLASAVRQIARARRELYFVRLIESSIAAAALILVILALQHAANPFEAGLGILVGGAIGFIWARRIFMRRREDVSAAASSVEHLDVTRNVRLQRVRLAQFIWIVLVLDLTFLIPWWVIGSRVHARRLTDLGSLLTMWLPIVGFIALFLWSVRLLNRARREMRDIDRLRDEYRDGVEGGENLIGS